MDINKYNKKYVALDSGNKKVYLGQLEVNNGRAVINKAAVFPTYNPFIKAEYKMSLRRYEKIKRKGSPSLWDRFILIFRFNETLQNYELTKGDISSVVELPGFN